MRVLLPLFALAFAVAPARAQHLLHELASPFQQAFGHFGYAVSGVPDADGDGRGDLLVGSFEFVGGRAYLFSGTTGALLRTLVPPNGASSTNFAFSVAGVEDLDGDGRGDLVAGEPGAGESGRAYVFSGATGALLHTLASPNAQPGGGFGNPVAAVPDVDGDGRGDLLIGAYGEDHDGSPELAGRAYLFSGATGTALLELRSPNEEEVGEFGWSVAGVPDADGDGRGDLLVGTPWEDGPGVDGRAYLFSSGTGALLHTFVSPYAKASSDFGQSVSGVADADGDGRGDVVIGAPKESPGSSPPGAGRAYVFSGATGGLLHELASPDAAGGYFGESVSGVADVDGDGRGDLLVGAWAEDPAPSPFLAGRAHVFSGATGLVLATLASPNEEEGSGFGDAVAGVPDADGDGRGDLLVGADSEDPGTSPMSAGRAYLFSASAAGVAVTLAPLDPPVVIPAEGGSFRFAVTVTNGTDAPQALDAWTEATYPDGSVRLALGPVAVVLGPGSGVERVVKQGVPGSLPGGAYVYTGYVGRYPDGAVASSAFPGTKAGASPVGAGAWARAGVGEGWPAVYDGGGLPVGAGDVWAGGAAASGAAAAALAGSVVNEGPAGFALHGPRPNPATAEAVIPFELPSEAVVEAVLYDGLGRRVAVVASGSYGAGPHAVRVDGTALPRGVYAVRFTAWPASGAPVVAVQRLTLAR